MAEDSARHEAMRQAAVGNTDGQHHAGALAIEYRNIDSLIPYVNNARTHSDEQVAQIAASIKEFGWTNPVLVDGDNGIIAGHGRVQAARKLEATEIPVIELQGLSEAQRRAYILADNRLAQKADWDIDLLEVELAQLKDTSFELDLTGFDSSDMYLLGINLNENSDFEEEIYDIESAEGFGRTQEEYEQSSIRQIILAFMADEFKLVVEAMGSYAEDNALSNNTEVVKHLLETNGYAVSQPDTSET